MRIYLINLARRPDRLAAMTRGQTALGLALERVEAVDAAAAEPDALDRWFEDGGPLGEIPRGDKACLLSHRLAWEKFLASGDRHAVFLEDDVLLSRGAGALLTDDGWIPAGCGGGEAGTLRARRSARAADRYARGRARVSRSAACCRATPARPPISCRAAAAELLLQPDALRPAGRSSAVQSQQLDVVRAACAAGSWCRPSRGRNNLSAHKSDIEGTRLGLARVRLRPMSSGSWCASATT